MVLDKGPTWGTRTSSCCLWAPGTQEEERRTLGKSYFSVSGVSAVQRGRSHCFMMPSLVATGQREGIWASLIPPRASFSSPGTDGLGGR